MIRTTSSVTPDDVQHLVLEGASWALYEKLLKDIGDRPIRVTYDRGTLEVTLPLAEHEDIKKLIGRMIEMLTFLLDMPVKSLGSATFRRKDRAKGLEPDECYYFRHEAKLRGRKRLDMKKDPPPELVVEIDITSRSVPRVPIYAALGVPEIWRYHAHRLECLHLEGTRYRVRKMSLAFAFLEPSLLQQFIDRLADEDETSIIREFVAWVRRNGWAD